MGHRQVAARPGLAEGTVRGWLRAAWQSLIAAFIEDAGRVSRCGRWAGRVAKEHAHDVAAEGCRPFLVTRANGTGESAVPPPDDSPSGARPS